jgi:hypothetical protein
VNKSIAMKMSTFFPAHLTQEEVIEKIYEAYNNFLEKQISPEPRKGKYIIEGATKEGIIIRMHITEKGLMISAYPILKD